MFCLDFGTQLTFFKFSLPIPAFKLGVLRLFTFNVIIDIFGSKSIILLIVFYLSNLFFAHFPFSYSFFWIFMSSFYLLYIFMILFLSFGLLALTPCFLLSGCFRFIVYLWPLYIKYINFTKIFFYLSSYPVLLFSQFFFYML